MACPAAPPWSRATWVTRKPAATAPADEESGAPKSQLADPADMVASFALLSYSQPPDGSRFRLQVAGAVNIADDSRCGLPRMDPPTRRTHSQVRDRGIESTGKPPCRAERGRVDCRDSPTRNAVRLSTDRQAPRPSSVRNGWLAESGSTGLGCDHPMGTSVASCQGSKWWDVGKQQGQTNDHVAEAEVK